MASLVQRLDAANRHAGVGITCAAMVGTGTRAEDIHAAALEAGMIDLKRCSSQLLTEGLTTVEEVATVVSVDI